MSALLLCSCGSGPAPLGFKGADFHYLKVVIPTEVEGPLFDFEEWAGGWATESLVILALRGWPILRFSKGGRFSLWVPHPFLSKGAYFLYILRLSSRPKWRDLSSILKRGQVTTTFMTECISGAAPFVV